MRFDKLANINEAAPLISMEGIVKTYYEGQPEELEILHGIDLTVQEGEFLAIVGESGSGKSTLMNIIGVLDKPTKGLYCLDGLDMGLASRDAMSEIRNRKIGFIFQNFNLIGRTSALQNVELPMLYAGEPYSRRIRKAKDLLESVGMGDRIRHQPNELSGGQKQRVAIARALANDPSILLADEPTGALDSATSRIIMDLFHKLNREQHKTVILITHSKELAAECPRIVTIRDGYNVCDTKGAEYNDIS
ncbi:MAG: ABC transporter ATP-binding protein [Clostridiales Family XIII bacterium]|jgi:putative ABC transport system ATP-binding protein|nr:ABC transporter ATP-binding protein [Clostridiales Family XIII bacterium]